MLPKDAMLSCDGVILSYTKDLAQYSAVFFALLKMTYCILGLSYVIFLI